MSKCKGCGAEIKWVKMISDNSMPVDKKPVKMIIIGEDLPEGTVSNFQPNRGHMVSVYMPHWTTCPKAKDFKNKE